MTRRSGLGRGLDALLPGGASEGLEGRGGVARVPIEQVDPNPRQPRKSFSEESIAELATSIAELGILQTILVRQGPAGRYEIVAGERRFRAAQSAGLEQVPVIVVDTDEAGSLQRALVENLHREDLNPVEEAAGYKQLIDEAGLTQEELGRRVGRNRVTVANMLRLLDLPTSVQRLLQEGRLTAAHGKAILSATPTWRERLAQRAAYEQLSVRETEEMVRRWEARFARPATASPESSQPTSAIVTETQRKLSEYLQTRVRIELGKRKGRIVLDFHSIDELERLLTLLTGESRSEEPQEEAAPDSS
ncbi:MAG TPA: ParB/RepB/Spo0J family partition protein [Actinomycetota bacterium]|nr:ParB/RepB/Spo0J family partition protein [Actinomycetota bacterium]